MSLDKEIGTIDEINEDNFEQELKNNGNNAKVDLDENNDFLVVFNDTHHEYLVDKTGNITLKGSKENEEEDSKKGLISDTEYVINKEKLTFSKIAVVGENEELKTVKEGLDYLCDNGYKENGAILLREGNHDTRDVHSGNSYNINSKYSEMSVSIIADSPGKTYMTGGEILLTENSASQWIELKFYDIIFIAPIYTNGSGMNMGGDQGTKEYYNCVFTIPVGGWNMGYQAAVANTYNCVFAGGKTQFYDSAPLNGISENCASTTEVIDPANGTKYAPLENITLDDEYRITSGKWRNTGVGTNPDGTQAHIGVYGGKYAWNFTSSEYADKRDFIYTNTAQVFEVPKTGYYKIEAYGAGGGKCNFVGTYIDDAGTGGYAAGVIKLNKGEKLYIYVGGKGVNGITSRSTLTQTTFNGGGAGIGSTDADDGGGAGGGATDIRLVSGEWDDFDSLKSRILVAGGGSGGAAVSTSMTSSSGGYGGGLTATGSIWYWQGNEVKNHSYNATQTSGYKFGIGENGYSYNNAGGAGAGGGYYGGYSSKNESLPGGAGGGSGYVSGYDGCDAISEDSTEDNIKHTGQSKHYSGKYFIDPVLSTSENKGDGYVTIEYIGENY